MFSRCRSCGAPIVWNRMKKSMKMHPVNIETIYFRPSQDGAGTYVTDDGEILKGTPVQDGEDDETVKCGSISHFATCPNADAHRKRGTKDDAQS